MPIKDVPYSKLEPLIKENLETEEHGPTYELIMEFRAVKNRGYLTKKDLEQVCQWKSPRAIWLIRENSSYLVRKRTADAFSTHSEKRKLALLTDLRGVSVPMASSILMLHNPKRYGVIDIRVWELLYKVGAVNTKPKGVGLGFKEWYRFLMIIRHFADKFNVKARDIERTFFIVHKMFQEGKLYDLVSA